MFWKARRKPSPADLAAFHATIDDVGIDRTSISYSIHVEKGLASSPDALIFVGFGQHQSGDEVGFCFEILNGARLDGTLISASAASYHQTHAWSAALKGIKIVDFYRALADSDVEKYVLRRRSYAI
jgi:hypothetical protein